MTNEELIKATLHYANDPMWDAHAEVPKSILRKLVERIRELETPIITVEHMPISQQTETIFPKDVADYTGHCPKCLRGPVTLAHFGHGKECEDQDGK